MILFIAAVITAVLIPVAVLWLLPVLVDVASLSRQDSGRGAPVAMTGKARLLVLVPAHDEAASIRACVSSILAARPGAADVRVCVVADHCADATATLARQAGAEVLAWTVLGESGKPRAIRWALNACDYRAYDAVVIVDADAVVDPGFLTAICAHAGLRDLAMQARVIVGNEHESPLTYLGAVLARMRYCGQYVLKQRAGLNAPLTGNGMCLGTDLLARIGWPYDTLTENWELYARCAVNGERIILATEAILTTVEAPTMSDGAIQRRRWQTGRTAVFMDYAAAIVSTEGIGWRQKLDVLGELAAPGPVFQAAAIIMGVAALVIVPTPVSLAVAACLLLALFHSIVWVGWACLMESDRVRVVRSLATLPRYALWRVWVMLPALRRDNRVWMRSPRSAIAAWPSSEATFQPAPRSSAAA